jgi:hypothetical protein
MVTIETLGRTRGSRIGRTTGLTTSPARPIRNTVPKPTVVAANRSANRDGTKGRNRAPHRNARTAYERQTIVVAAASRYGLERLTADRTSAQFSFRQTTNNAAASRHNAANSFCDSLRSQFERTFASDQHYSAFKPQHVGWTAKATTAWC